MKFDTDELGRFVRECYEEMVIERVNQKLKTDSQKLDEDIDKLEDDEQS